MNYSKLDIGRQGEINFPVMCLFNSPGDNRVLTFLNLRQVSKAVKNDVEKVFSEVFSEVFSTRENIKNRSVSRTLNFFDRFLWWAANETNFLYKNLFTQGSCRDYSFCVHKSGVFVIEQESAIVFSNLRLSDILENNASENWQILENNINIYNKNKNEGLTDLRQNINYNFIGKIFGLAFLVFLYFFLSYAFYINS